jgi:superfamily II DNA or RNA helicase
MVLRDHWDPYDNQPIDEVGKYCYLLRKVCNSDITRIHTLARIVLKHNKVIVFYNFNYELEMIKMNFHNILISEWNGQKHEPIPSGDRWMYLVQFSASEGWNCIQSDCIVFFSQSYSYKQTVQAAGRIDRTNTKFTDLYYYHLKSKSSIDLAIARAIQNKKQFNESAFKMK